MKPVIYQLFVRHFSNMMRGGVPWGSLQKNGCGRFNDITSDALNQLVKMGITHVWLTGVLRHATQTPHDGLNEQPSSIVKGIEGSPYAIIDYYDVDPDLAYIPNFRMDEFRDLIERCRQVGLVPMIDFVPNHVSRAYHSTTHLENNFGDHDDISQFFTWDNSFFYIQYGMGEGTPPFRLPHGIWKKEQFCAKVTGNNAVSWQPGEFDWYETVKLNYGYNFLSSPDTCNQLPGFLSPLDSVPKTWRIMDDIIHFWQNYGVGGFRCDMAHMVPMPFWKWLNARARVRDPHLFMIAEAYDDSMKTTVGDPSVALLDSGFNGVYDSQTYHLAHHLYEEDDWANDFDSLNTPTSPFFHHGVRFIENHDEPRICAPQYWGGVGRIIMPAIMTLLYTSSKGPILVYNGQEVGEEAKGPGGFGGDNGRTSIFDYTCLPRLQQWVDHGHFSDDKLPIEDKKLRTFHANLLCLMRHPSIDHGEFYGLNWSNMDTPNYGREPKETKSGHWVYSFLRHDYASQRTLLIVCNLSSTNSLDNLHISIPTNAWDWCQRHEDSYQLVPILGNHTKPLLCSLKTASTTGIPIPLLPGEAMIFEITSIPQK
ncbi:MAG: alpha-amylase family glycosyl hydrolase [Akkermansia sp.]